MKRKKSLEKANRGKLDISDEVDLLSYNEYIANAKVA